MLVRSPRKLALLSFTALLFVIIVLFQAPWREEVRILSDYTQIWPAEDGNRIKNGNAGIASEEAHIDTSEVSSRLRVSEQGLNASLHEAEGQGQGQGNVEQSKVAHSSQRKMLPWQKILVKSLVDGEKDRNRTTIGDVEDWRGYMNQMLQWPRPTWVGHWPPFGDYVERAYDPNRWEHFDIDEGLYLSTHNQLESNASASPEVYDPFPMYNSKVWKSQWKGKFVSCMGPRGMRLNESTDDQVFAYKGVPRDTSQVFTGGYDVLGLDGDVCFDRYSRYGPYGFGDDMLPGDVVDWKAPKKVPDWATVNWGVLQDDCLEANKERYSPEARVKTEKKTGIDLPGPGSEGDGNDDEEGHASSPIENPTHSEVNVEKRHFWHGKSKNNSKYHHRTAVLIRAWTGYKYEANDIMAIRAMITELSLASGGEYNVYLFVHVKDRSLDIFGDSELYEDVLRRSVPEELRSIAILWSESIFPKRWYPEVGDWQVYWHQFMCVQWFSLMHPEYDYVWNWETDARYIGHHYHFLEKVASFADSQPRKLLWERSKRFYIPSIHGTYKEFVESTHDDVLRASENALIPEPVWGPRPWAHANPPQQPLGPIPPTSFQDDDFQWGVGEPADLITLLPIWDPRNTSWSYKDKIWNYIPNVRPIFTPSDGQADWFTHENFTQIDRRVFINTVARFSKRMLLAMHNENLVGRSMQAEMWPATVALNHGLKAVYAPHPIFQDRRWPTEYAEAIFDAHATVEEKTGAPTTLVDGAWTEQGDSPYNHDREYNFQGWSWYFASKFPRRLYRRWLGWEIDWQIWGEERRVVGGKGSDGEGEVERMCVTGMLLHPIKGMREGRIRL